MGSLAVATAAVLMVGLVTAVSLTAGSLAAGGPGANDTSAAAGQHGVVAVDGGAVDAAMEGSLPEHWDAVVEATAWDLPPGDLEAKAKALLDRRHRRP